MKAVLKRCISVKRYCKRRRWLLCLLLPLVTGGFIPAYHPSFFDSSFEQRAGAATRQLEQWNDDFSLAAVRTGCSTRFLQSLVFPEVLRYNRLRDGLETETLRTLYVRFGADYADFSIGLFQMKPSFAETVELQAARRLPATAVAPLQLAYQSSDPAVIRLQRVQRLQDPGWQLRYLTAFVLLCRDANRYRHFVSEEEQMQWFALLYNGGLQASPGWIRSRIAAVNAYLAADMPGTQFRYAALATWYFRFAKRKQQD